MKATKSFRLVCICPECGGYAHFGGFTCEATCYMCSKSVELGEVFDVPSVGIEIEYWYDNLIRNVALVGLHKLSMRYQCSRAPMSQQVKRARFLERNNPVLFEGYTKYVLSGKG